MIAKRATTTNFAKEKMRNRLAGVFCLLAATDASANSIEVAALGAGTATCGQYSSLYKADPTGADNTFVGWVTGFLSGLNLAALSRGEQSRNLGDLKSTTRLLHSYCDTHPLQRWDRPL